MKIDREVYRYIEYELLHYEDSKKELENLKMEIIEASPEPSDGQPKCKGGKSDPTEQKAMKLLSNVAITKITKTINAIDRVYSTLNRDYLKFFEWNYIKRAGIVKTCREVNISEKTYYRWKDNIVYSVGRELGLI